MNRLTITGNLTHNPESRVANTQNGAKTVCNFTVAVNRVVRGQKITEYFRVSCWEKQADNAMKYLAKGRKVAVTGSVSVSTYQANDGTTRASLEVNADDVEFLTSRQEAQEADNQAQAYAQQPAYTQQPTYQPPAPAPQQQAFTSQGFVEVEDDDLPF